MKAAPRILSILMALMLLAGVSQAKPDKIGSLTGTITEAETGVPISGATITIAETGDRVRSDSSGVFVVTDLRPGTFHLIIEHPEYGRIENMDQLVVSIKPGKMTYFEESFAKRPVVLDMGDESRYKDGDISSSSERLRLEEQESAQSRSGNEKALYFEATMSAPSVTMPGATQGLMRTPPPAPVLHKRAYPSYEPTDMYFRDYGTSGFVDTRYDHLSTFAFDVDDASYTIAREYLNDGNRVPTDAVRVEEFINHFNYGYNPESHQTFRIFTEQTDSPFDEQLGFFKVAIKGQELPKRDRSPLNITAVVDVSGSMGYDNRMQVVRSSLEMLADRLNKYDRIAIVAYSNWAETLLSPTRGDQKHKIRMAINRLMPRGSTNAEAGLTMGYDIANEMFDRSHNNMVLLLSDGVANVGNTSAGGIMHRIGDWATRGLVLNTIGYGMGNYNDELLEQLAQKGDGRYAYVNSRDEARRYFVENMVMNFELLARDVKIQVDFNPEIVQAYRLIGYENRDVADHRFRDNHQDGGEVGFGHEVTALYEIEFTRRARSGNLASVTVRWTDIDGHGNDELKEIARFDRHAPQFDRVRPELQLCVVAAKFGELLKNTYFSESVNFHTLARMATNIERQLPSEETRELSQLVRRASELYDYHAYRHDDDRRYTPYADDNYKRRR